MTMASKALQDNSADRKEADDVLMLFKMRNLHENLAPRDYALLKLCADKPIDVESLPAKDAHSLLWLVFYKLIKLWVDQQDRVWLRTSLVGRELLKEEP